MELDLSHLRTWIGRTELTRDVVTAAPMHALSATLDRDEPPPRDGDTVPPGWHWLYFLPVHRQSALGADGHAERGGFLPPVPLPRRMWAGSRIAFHRELRVGQTITRVSRIEDVQHKAGQAGDLVFVKVRHEISASDGGSGVPMQGQTHNQPLAIVDEHDIVYRAAAKPSGAASSPQTANKQAKPAQTAPEQATWTRTITPDDVLLFRYSALTFNGHRIHYDRRYVTEVEGYPGLVVHGPLLATLMLDLLRRNLANARVQSFEFRAIKPVFDIAAFNVCGRHDEASGTVHLWIEHLDGAVAMDARASVFRHA